MTERVNDVYIAHAIRSRLQKILPCGSFRLFIHSKDGVVRVAGYVELMMNRQIIERIVRSTPGVRKYQGSISVRGNATNSQKLTK